MPFDPIALGTVSAERRPILAPAGSRWRAMDTLCLVGVTALAGLIRLQGITHPNALVFDEFYAADACLYVMGPEGHCPATAEISVVHPPMGKWLIGAGIRLFGFTPAGWRVAPLVAGTLSVAVLYLLARRLLGSTLAAALAAGLLAFDLLHFVMSRTAMLDIFVVFFGLLTFLGLVYDAGRARADKAPAAGRASRFGARAWLFGAGLAGGAAVASKWSGVYLLLTVIGLAVLLEAARTRPPRVRQALRSNAGPIFVALGVVPAAVYVLSFAGRVDGTIYAWPWTPASWAHGVVERHRMMLEHHTGSLYTHPYTSPPWSWPFVKRPVLFYFHESGAGRYEEILALGNPLLWGAAVLALLALLWRFRRHPGARARAVIVAGFLAGYVPWFVITREQSFLYYFLPAVPFLYLALALVTAGIPGPRLRGFVAGVLAAASAGTFLFFRPMLTADPLGYPEWERRLWFQDCGPAPPGLRRAPVTRPIPPPAGWCWL